MNSAANRSRRLEYGSCSAAALALACLAAPAFAQGEDGAPNEETEIPQPEPTSAPVDEIVITARKREETLLEVPVAATAVTGDEIEQRGLRTVADVAKLSPGVNINSDAVGRAFIAIRGVGVTLVGTVQPGVGLFIDGVYQPNTSYLNNPVLDVARIEVLRGPQGTLYGKNTLGGAINVITREPGNAFESRFIGSYAGPDDSSLISGAVGGPIVEDRLQFRIAASHQKQDGFLENTLLGIDANPRESDSLNATLRAVPVGDTELIVKGYYNRVEGASTPYARVEGPTDYSDEVRLNAANIAEYEYSGANARLTAPLDAINTEMTLIGAYDRRESGSEDSDGDFGPVDIVRTSGSGELETATAELRFDSELSDNVTSLIGFFASRETSDDLSTTRVVPLSVVSNTVSATEADTYAIFGTLFWDIRDDLELSVGLRYDKEKREATGGAIISGAVQPIPPASIESEEIQPRVTLTKIWNDSWMTYGSIARGYRGGGFNSPLAPSRTYEGDSAWTYEIGSKFQSLDNRLTFAGAIFYNDYSDYIGQNSIAPSSAGGFVTVDLNTGDVETYGAEAEVAFQATPQWSISGTGTLLHARIIDSTPYTDITGRQLPTDKLTFQPAWNFSLSSDYVVPLAQGDLVFAGTVIGKGERQGSSLSETFSPTLEDYFLVNASATYQIDNIEFSLFADNLFDEEYFESYIDQSLLVAAGVPASNLGIIGAKRRIGVRARVAF